MRAAEITKLISNVNCLMLALFNVSNSEINLKNQEAQLNGDSMRLNLVTRQKL